MIPHSILKRINRTILLLRCLARAIFHGPANKIPSKIFKVVVVPTGKLGDVVCCTPVLQAIRTHLPQTQIIVAGNSKLHHPLLADSGLVDGYLDLEEKGAIARAKDVHADVALITGPSYQATALLYTAGVPLVVAATVEGGFSPAETRPYKILKKMIKTFPYRMGEYAPRERLKVLEPLGIFSDDTTKHLGFSEAGIKKTEQFFLENSINVKKDFVVGVSLSAGNKIKEWPIDRFAEVVDHLNKKYNAKIIITGGQNDRSKTEQLIQCLSKNSVVIDTAGQFDLDTLKAFISKLHLFISVDSGPIYMAEAFNVSTLDIVGPVDERVQPPRGFIHRNVIPPNRIQPELSILNARSYDKEEALHQVLSITVLAVKEAIDELIGDLDKL